MLSLAFTSHAYIDVIKEFPRKPMGLMRQHIVDEANSKLAHYIALPPPPEPLPPGVELPVRPTLPDGVKDTPLVRLFNFLRWCKA